MHFNAKLYNFVYTVMVKSLALWSVSKMVLLIVKPFSLIWENIVKTKDYYWYSSPWLNLPRCDCSSLTLSKIIAM